MSESLRDQPKDDIWEAFDGAKEVANRDLMGERRVRSFFYGLASQRVFETEDGRLLLDETTFESDGAFMQKLSLVDQAAHAAKCWRGRAVNNPDCDGLRWDVSGERYDELLAAINGLLESHPVSAAD